MGFIVEWRVCLPYNCWKSPPKDPWRCELVNCRWFCFRSTCEMVPLHYWNDFAFFSSHFYERANFKLAGILAMSSQTKARTKQTNNSPGIPSKQLLSTGVRCYSDAPALRCPHITSINCHLPTRIHLICCTPAQLFHLLTPLALALHFSAWD